MLLSHTYLWQPDLSNSFVLQRKVELNEFAFVHVPNCCFGIITCSTCNGAECIGSHFRTWKETQVYVAATSP